MILDLISNKDPILKIKIPKFDFSNLDLNPIQIALDLSETMIHNNGLGLSANQVGLAHRVFVITGSPILAMFNPYIVNKSDEEIYLEEGCLSTKGLSVKIKRPKEIKVRYTKPNQDVVTENFVGMTARIIQHEYDHLEGIDFLSRANIYHREQARNKYKKFLRVTN